MKLQLYSALRRRIRAVILCGIICAYYLISSVTGTPNTEYSPSSSGNENIAVVSIF